MPTRDNVDLPQEDHAAIPCRNTSPEPSLGDEPANGSNDKYSVLVVACTRLGKTFTPARVKEFLAWQATRRVDGEEQKCFREDAQGYPQLLVFATMQKKSPFIHLMHSAGIYPRVPGAGPEWQGKSIGFLGDCTRFASPHMTELGRTTTWG